MHFFVKTVLLLAIALGLHAQSGLTQKHLVSVTPTASQSGVAANTAIAIVFDKPIVSKSVHKYTIVLKSNKKIQGTTVIKDNNKLIFTPNKALESFTYNVFVEKVTLQITSDDAPLEKPQSGYKKFLYELCAFFYNDVSKCPLCQLFCNSKTEQTEKINYNFSVENNTPTVESIALDKTTVELNEGNQTTIAVTVTLSDGSSKEITDVEWIIGNKTVVSMTKNVVHARRAGNTTLQAKYDNKLSDILNIHVYEQINGYKLPPEPDEALNNSTLLGIDSNNNGVRDDVERYVIKRYAQDPESPKTKTALAMQYVWAEQKIIDNPTIESSKYEFNTAVCESYWMKKKTKDMTTLNGIKYHVKHGVFNDTEIKDRIYNTRARIEQKFSYNSALSGNILTLPQSTLNKCQINIDELGE